MSVVVQGPNLVPDGALQKRQESSLQPKGVTTVKAGDDGTGPQTMPWFVGNNVRTNHQGIPLKLNFFARVFVTLEDSSSGRVARCISLSVVCLIAFSTLAFVLSSVPVLNYQPSTCENPICDPATSSSCTTVVCEPQPRPAFSRIEDWTIALFTVEYLLRAVTVWAVPIMLIDREGHAAKKYEAGEPGPLRKSWWYLTQSLNIVDLAAILPYYISLATGGNGLGFLRVIRLARVMRIFKLGKYSESSALITNTLSSSSPALSLLMFFMIIMMILFGSLIYFFEQGTFKATSDYPDGAYYRPTIDGTAEEISPFSSIPLSFYWVVITTTTTGFGDFYPTTPLGRLTAAIAAYVGILCVALPVTIVGTNFTNEYEKFYVKSRQRKQSQASSAVAEGASDGQSKPAPAGLDKSGTHLRVQNESSLDDLGVGDNTPAVEMTALPPGEKTPSQLDEAEVRRRELLIVLEELARLERSVVTLRGRLEDLTASKGGNAPPSAVTAPAKAGESVVAAVV